MNLQLIQDEGHRNPDRASPNCITACPAGCARAIARFCSKRRGRSAGYALYREERAGIYLRHLFVVRERRRRGLGRTMIEILKREIWPGDKRLTVEVLVSNEPAMRFWRAGRLQ